MYIYMSADLTRCKLLHSIAQRVPADDHLLKTHLEMCSHTSCKSTYIYINVTTYIYINMYI